MFLSVRHLEHVPKVDLRVKGVNILSYYHMWGVSSIFLNHSFFLFLK